MTNQVVASRTEAGIYEGEAFWKTGTGYESQRGLTTAHAPLGFWQPAPCAWLPGTALEQGYVVDQFALGGQVVLKKTAPALRELALLLECGLEEAPPDLYSRQSHAFTPCGLLPFTAPAVWLTRLRTSFVALAVRPTLAQVYAPFEGYVRLASEMVVYIYPHQNLSTAQPVSGRLVNMATGQQWQTSMSLYQLFMDFRPASVGAWQAKAEAHDGWNASPAYEGD